MQVRLFLTNICSDQDPLDEFMASAAWIPDVDWLTREMHKIKQVDAVQWLKDAIGQYQLVMNIKRLHQTDSRRAELFRLVGKEKHPLRGTLALISENSNIDIMYRARMLKVSSAINQSLQVMRSCELLQFHELYMYDPKFAGAGLDQTKGNKGQQENAHLNFNTQTPRYRRRPSTTATTVFAM